MNIIRVLPNFAQTRAAARRNALELKETDPLHFGAGGKTLAVTSTKSADLGKFGNMVLSSLEQTNNNVLDSELLQQQMLVSPDTVDPSTVVVSMLKADLQTSLAKAIIDRSTAAYKELTTIR